jgi:ribonucleoside-diphosphate reductase alpha chain
MAKFLVETYYTCTFKVNHYLDDINEVELKNLEKKEKFELKNHAGRNIGRISITMK